MNPSRLAERLREVVKGAVPAAGARVGERFPIAAQADASSGAGLEDHLGGQWLGEGSARCFVVEHRSESSLAHGTSTIRDLAEAFERTSSHAVLLEPGAAIRPPFVFFDLETTGLNGGAGTYAFLFGCGWFGPGGGFTTKQYLLVSPVGERQMLTMIAGELSRAGALVSFNGRSFDAPLLETRYMFHRLEWTAGRLPHLDILHPARRFWGAADCSLGTLERHVLGAPRIGDVAGFEIPARYFEFVRSGDPRPLAAVLDHNRRDLLSLASLTVRLLRLIESGPAEAVDGREALALGRLYSAAGLANRARESFGRAVEMAANSDEEALRIAALRARARSERGWRRHAEAATCWQQLLDSPECPLPVAREAAEALAIHHEHRIRDLQTARGFALRSLADDDASPSARDAGRHRLARIERKMKRLSDVIERSLFPSLPLPLPPSSGFQTSARRTSS